MKYSSLPLLYTCNRQIHEDPPFGQSKRIYCTKLWQVVDCRRSHRELFCVTCVLCAVGQGDLSKVIMELESVPLLWCIKLINLLPCITTNQAAKQCCCDITILANNIVSFATDNVCEPNDIICTLKRIFRIIPTYMLQTENMQ